MEVVVTVRAISHAKLPSNRHHQQTNTQFFYKPDALPVAQPTVSKHWREKYHIPWTCLPQPHLGVFQLLSLITNSSWCYLGRVAMLLISPLMPVPQIGSVSGLLKSCTSSLQRFFVLSSGTWPNLGVISGKWAGEI